MRTWTLLALVVMATPAAVAQTPVVIDFDDLTAPCDLELEFQPPAPEIPQLSTAGISIVIVTIAVLGAALIRRSTGV